MTIQKYSAISAVNRRLEIYEVDVTFLCDGGNPDGDVCPEPVEQDDMDDCQLEEKRASKF